MRLAVVAGMRGSGKTTALREAVGLIPVPVGFIANNPESEAMMRSVCRDTDHFPFKSPCARMRQFRYRTDLMCEKPPALLICEPPGTCEDEAAPLVNPIYAVDRDRVSFAPLVTFFEPGKVLGGLTSRTVEGLRLRNMADESDVAAVSFADLLADDDREAIAHALREVNPDVRVLFVSPVTGEGIRELASILESEGSYTRPLFN